MTDMDETITLDALPTDILILIIQHLSPHDLLSLCGTSHAFRDDPELRFSPAYWRNAVRRTFRVPNNPVIAGDGRRWMKLYRKMRTQTQLYGFGSNEHQCFGPQPMQIEAVHVPLHGAGMRRVHHMRQKTSMHPVQLDKGQAAMVADVQCGGWSTVILDSTGAMFIMGLVDGMDPQQLRHSRMRPQSRAEGEGPQRLTFPLVEEEPDHNRNPSRPENAIQQFSSGRCHILGLADTGHIWSWHAGGTPAVQVKFLTIDLTYTDTGSSSTRPGAVRQVVAGWNRSSAYIVGTGIVHWSPSNDAEQHGEADQSEIDTMVVFDSKVVVDSGHLRSNPERALEDSDTSDGVNLIGEATNHIVLCNFIVLVTDLGKVFTSSLNSRIEGEPARTVQIYPQSMGPGPADAETFALDVHGSHLNFAIIKRNGEVLLGDEGLLETVWSSAFASPSQSFMTRPQVNFRKIPCLQHTGVIRLAFGDYHFHALHTDGTITSYGHDPQSVGAHGLGPLGNETNSLRGMKQIPNSPDRDLLPQCFTTGRRIIFEQEKRDWLRRIWEDPSEEAQERKNLCAQRLDVRAEVSEWVEQKLISWDKSTSEYLPGEEGSVQDVQDEAEDDLSPYFALNVTAAGWSSAALVLVDEEKARLHSERHKIRKPLPETAQTPTSADASNKTITAVASNLANMAINAVNAGVKSFLGIPDRAEWIWAQERFPRLKLRSGEIMPGTIPVQDWTGPREWKDIEWVTE